VKSNQGGFGSAFKGRGNTKRKGSKKKKNTNVEGRDKLEGAQSCRKEKRKKDPTAGCFPKNVKPCRVGVEGGEEGEKG